MSTVLEIGLTPRYLFLRHPPTVTDDAIAGQCKVFADQLEELVGTHEDEVRRLRVDQRLSPMGRQQAAEKSAQQTATQIISAIAVLVLPVKQQIAEDERSLLGPSRRLRVPEGISAEDTRLAEAEARTHFRSLDQIARDAAYLEGARAGDSQIMRTFELTTAATRLIGEDVLRQGAEAYAAATSPAEFDLLEQRRSVFIAMKSNARQATANFAERGTFAGLDKALRLLYDMPSEPWETALGEPDEVPPAPAGGGEPAAES